MFVCVCVCVIGYIWIDVDLYIAHLKCMYELSNTLTIASVNHPTCILSNVHVCMICISITSNMLTCVALTLAIFLLPPVGLGSYTLCALVTS